jgi:hypothetical protein
MGESCPDPDGDFRPARCYSDYHGCFWVEDFCEVNGEKGDPGRVAPPYDSACRRKAEPYVPLMFRT